MWTEYTVVVDSLVIEENQGIPSNPLATAMKTGNLLAAAMKTGSEETASQLSSSGELY